MRVPVLLTLLLAVALVASGCMGPDDPDTRLAEACERQIEEVAEDESSTPTAKSTDERLEDETLVECAGQKTKVVAADEEGKDADKGSGGSDTGEAEDPGSGGDEAKPAELDPAARELFAQKCGSCHVLSDAETTGTFGPSLDDTTLDSTGIAHQIREGGGGMPPNLAEGEDVDTIAEYVAAAAGSE